MGAEASQDPETGGPRTGVWEQRPARTPETGGPKTALGNLGRLVQVLTERSRVGLRVYGIRYGSLCWFL